MASGSWDRPRVSEVVLTSGPPFWIAVDTESQKGRFCGFLSCTASPPRLPANPIQKLLSSRKTSKDPEKKKVPDCWSSKSLAWEESPRRGGPLLIIVEATPQGCRCEASH